MRTKPHSTEPLQNSQHTQSSYLLQTNRKFYIRRKKDPNHHHEPRLSKAMRCLTKNTQSVDYTNMNKNNTLFSQTADIRKVKICVTQKNQQCQNSYLYKNQYSGRFWGKGRGDSRTDGAEGREIVVEEARSKLEGYLRKWQCGGFLGLYKCFQKCVDCKSFVAFQNCQLMFYEQFTKLAEAGLSKQRILHNSIIQQQRTTSTKHNALLLQNLKLQKQNIILRTQLASPQSSYPPQPSSSLQPFTANPHIQNKTCKIIEDIKSQIKSSSMLQNSLPVMNRKDFITNFVAIQRKLGIKVQQLEILRKEINQYKEDINILREDKRQLKERIIELKAKNQGLCSEIIAWQLRNKKTGISDDKKDTIMAMQVQEIDSYRYEISELRKHLLGLSKKYKVLINKLKKTNAQNGDKIGTMYRRQTQMFPQQFQAFQQIHSKLQPQPRLHLLPRQSSKIQKSCPLYQQAFTQKQLINNKEAVKKLYTIGSQYYHPTFYLLIAQDITFFGIDQNNYEHFNQTIKLNFIGTMRAIMDSKFNQFVIGRDTGKVASFPAFVLAWLNAYQLGPGKKIERVAACNLSTRETVCIFYVNLFSEKLNLSWQAITFRQFLLETFGKDELYFYLNLRYLLLGGDMLNDLSFCFEQIYYIQFSRCLKIMQKIFKQSEIELKKIYEQFLKRSITYIRKKSYIDIHFMLRLMLEYYQSTKQKLIQNILKNMDLLNSSQNSNNNIRDSKRIYNSLTDFHKIVQQYFDFLSYTQIVDLYRRCFCVGNGNVSNDVIVTVLGQENVFLRWVQMYVLHAHIKCEGINTKQRSSNSQNQHQTQKSITKSEHSDPQYRISPDLKWLHTFEKEYRYTYNSQLKRQIQNLGIQNLLHNINRSWQLTPRSLHNRLQLCFTICLSITKKMLMLQPLNAPTLEQVFILSSEFITKLSNVTLRKNQIHSIMQYLKLKAASRRIVKFYKKKKMEMTRSIHHTYSGTLMEEEKGKKNEMLRSEFIQLIQEAKQKKVLQSKANIEEI